MKNINVNELRTFNSLFNDFNDIKEFCDCRQIDKHELAIICRKAETIEEIDKICKNECWWSLEEIFAFNATNDIQIIDVRFEFDKKILTINTDADGELFDYFFNFSDSEDDVYSYIDNHKDVNSNDEYLYLVDVVIDVLSHINK